MRYSGPVNISFLGDEAEAAQYIPAARAILGQLVNQAELSRDVQRFSARSAVLSDGTIISVRSVGSLVREITIDVRPSEGFSVEILQYMFSLRGAGGVPAPTITAGEFDFVQSAWVGVIIILREAAPPELLSFPLVSTREDIKPNFEDEWEFIQIDSNLSTLSSVADKLPIRRYEVAHAETKHLSQPDYRNIVHAPWIQAGIPPYNGFAHTKATQWFTGEGTGIFEEESGGSINTAAIEDMPLIKPFRSTDKGYEADLSIYQRPEMQGRIPIQGASEGGAPETDWYTSYARARIESANVGAREYGITIDANQKLYVWRTDAEGTADTTGSSFIDQAIKTSVATSFVKSKQLVFPSGVYTGDISYRDSFNQSASGLTELGFDASRYTWIPDSTGLNFVAIGMRYKDLEVEPPGATTPVQAYWGEAGFLDGVDTPPPTDKRLYRVPETVVLKLSIVINTTGPDLSAFELSVGQVTVQEVEDGFAPVKVGFAGSGSFDDTEKDDLLVAGIKAFYRSGTEPFFPAFNDLRARNVVIAGWTPRSFVPLGGEVFIIGGDQYFSYTEMRGRFNGTSADISSGGVPEVFGKWLHDKSLEATLSVQKPDTEEEVYSVCIRRALFPMYQDYAPNDYFTAEISGLDLEHGVVALTTRSCKQDPELRSLRSDDSKVPEKDPWLSTNITCEYPQGFFILRGDEVIHRWTQDEGEMENHLKYEPLGLSVNKKREVTGVTTHRQTSEYFMGDYLIDLEAVSSDNGFYSFSNYQLGLETYAFLYAKHFGEGYFLGGLIANKDMVSFTGSLLCYEEGTLTTNAATNELTGENGIFNKELDVIVFNDGSISTHQELWEEAFARQVDTEMNLELKSENVDTWMRSDGTNPNIIIDIFRNNVIVKDEDNVDTFRINVDEPAGWMYPAFRKTVLGGFGLFPRPLNNDQEDARLRREQQTLLDPTFSGRAYGYTR